MKFIYSSDVHGSYVKYKNLVKVAVKHGADSVILGGDLFPYVPSAWVSGQQQFIPHFVRFANRLSDYDIELFWILGNDDLVFIDDELNKALEDCPTAHWIDKRPVEYKGFTLVGMSEVVEFPHELKDRCRLDKKGDSPYRGLQNGEAHFYFQRVFTKMRIEKYLANYLPSQPSLEEILNTIEIDDWKNTILVTHAPPYGSGLDVVGQGFWVGSRAVTEFIERKQPAFSLHGHVHESPWQSGLWNNTIIRTVAIQPGQHFWDRELTYVFVDTDTYETERYTK
jgi:uncharacterized protein